MSSLVVARELRRVGGGGGAGDSSSSISSMILHDESNVIFVRSVMGGCAELPRRSTGGFISFSICDVSFNSSLTLRSSTFPLFRSSVIELRNSSSSSS